jgi:predicted nucleic acid-binding protein
MGQKNPEAKWFHHLKENPHVVKKFAAKLEEYTLIILQITNLAVIEISKDQTLHGLTLIKEYGLLPRDAIHAATALLSGAGTIITTDHDFASITNLQVYTCNPKSLNI